MSTTYPLATATWDDEEYEAIQQVVASGMFTMGPKVKSFEESFAQYVESKYCVMVNSGSSANLLMIAALFFMKLPRLKAGDEIIVPAVSWSTTYYPLQQYGLKLKFVDVDIETLNYDLHQLEAAVTEQTKAIMVVNLLGNPNDFARINNIIANKDIVVVEDNCESMGARFNNKHCGTFGIMGSYSAFFSHHISTMEGGLIVTDDEELYHILLSLRAHGWTRNLPKENHVCGTKSDDAFTEAFRFVLPGYNVRPLEMSGAIGISQVKKLPKMIEARRENAKRFGQVMKQFPQLIIQNEISESSWFGFSMIVREDAGFSRAQLIQSLNKHGIETRPIVAGNFAKNEVMKWFDYSIHGQLANAEFIDKSGLFIGNHHYRLEKEFDVLQNALQDLSAK